MAKHLYKQLMPIILKYLSRTVTMIIFTLFSSITCLMANEIGASIQKDLIEKQIPFSQQDGKITGKITDAVGPVVGATVAVKGTSNGVISGLDGEFSLSDLKKGDIIVISYISYLTQEIKYTGQASLKIKLLEDIEVLDEVVVVGFGTQKKESVVGAIQTIKPSELRVPSSSLSNSFAGRIAGVIAVQRGGEPGADGSTFWIRGVSTFASNTSPLVFIDNVEVSIADLNALSPEVIEGFSILKDATATALYGARGANGVMLVTTRSGKNMEKARINIRFENSFTQPIQMVDIADGADYMVARNYSVLNRTPDAQPYYTDEIIDATRRDLDPIAYPNVDWQDYLFKDLANRQTANFNVMGGGKRATYFISATVDNDNGMLKEDSNNDYDNNIHQLRMSIQGNIGVELTKTTRANVRLNTQVVDYSGSAVGTEEIYSSLFHAPGIMFAPVLPGKGGEDHIFFGNKNGGPTQGRYKNPYADMVKGYATKNSSTVIASFDVSQDLDFITPGLNAKGLVSFKNYSITNVTRSFTPYYYAVKDFSVDESGIYTYDYEAMTKGTTALSTETTNGGDRLLNYQFSVDYARSFNDVHHVGAMAIYLQRNYNLNAPEGFYQTLPTRNQGFAGRLTYDYDHRYMLEANFGYNGSENFADGSRFGFFPSFAIGYNISNEYYFEPIKNIVSNLKVRGSYGIVGNSSTDSRFPYLTYVDLGGSEYTFGDDWQNTAKGATITRYGTENSSWETGVKMNVGFELGLLNSLNITFDWFSETRSDIFMRRNVIPAETGIIGDLRPFANLGKVKNGGVDINVEYNKAINQDFIVSVKGSFTYAKNKLLEADEPFYGEKEQYRSDINKPLNCYTGLVALGLFKDEDDVKNSPEQTFSPNMKPGDIKYKDLNDDGKIDGNDMMQLGDPSIPQIVYGFGTSIKYKSFDFSMFFQGAAKTSLMLQNIHPFTSDQTTLLDFVAQDYWTEDNTDAAYPRLIGNLDDHNNYKNSTFWLRDGSFLRLKNLEIGYTYKMARFFASGQNLLTFSPFDHWDPELGGGRGLKYPNLRMVTVGLQLNL